MLTPQDLQEVSFEKAKIGGYVMKSVDEVLEPLIEDYITLYKENAVLKSKMRLLVDRLEYYRANEAKLKEAVEEAKQGHASAGFARPDEAKREQEKGQADCSAAIAEEAERLRLAKQATADFVNAVEAQIVRQQQALENIKALKLPQQRSQSSGGDGRANSSGRRTAGSPENIVAEIEQNVSRITGDSPRRVDYSAATKVLPKLDERTTTKLANLQLGRNYQPE